MGRGRLRLVLKHYTGAQFHDDFVPAERAWLASLTASPMREGLHLAYLDTLVGLGSLSRTGVLANKGGDHAVAEALIGLRAVLSSGIGQSEMGVSQDLLSELSWRVAERPFVSSVPVLGPGIARFRELWNSVSAKWYVRPLIEQQNEVNRRLVQQVQLVTEQLALAQKTVEAMQQTVSAMREAVLTVQGTLSPMRDTLDAMQERLLAAERGYLAAQEAGSVVQETVTALDREATDGRRLFAQAIYGLREDLDRLQSWIETSGFSTVPEAGREDDG
jgi:hypothetical protein